MWICGALGFLVVLIGIILSFFPPGETTTAAFELQLVGGTAASILIGLFLYWRGARSKKSSLSLEWFTLRKTVWTPVPSKVL